MTPGVLKANAHFLSSFPEFLQTRAHVGLYPSYFDGTRTHYGLMPEEGLRGPVLLNVPHLRQDRFEDRASAVAALGKPFHVRAGLPLYDIVNAYGVGDFGMEREAVQTVIDEAKEDALHLEGSAVKLREEARRFADDARESAPPDNTEATDSMMDRRASRLIAFEKRINAAIFFAMAGGREDLKESAAQFGKAAALKAMLGYHSAAAMVSQVTRLTYEEVQRMGDGVADEDIALLINRSLPDETLNIFNSLKHDHDPVSYGLRIFLGVDAGWRIEGWDSHTEGILLQSSIWNFRNGRPDVGAGDLARIVFKMLKAKEELEAWEWFKVADLIKAVAKTWKDLGEDEGVVAEAFRFARSARRHASEPLSAEQHFAEEQPPWLDNAAE